MICRVLHIMGYPVFYSDLVAKKILSSDIEVISKVKDVFGEGAYNTGVPDHKYLAEAAFNHPEKLQQLNSIVHPAVRYAFTQWVKSQKNKIVFNEAAILFESGSYRNFSKTILVTSPVELRIERLMKRDNSSVESIKLRMQNQWSDERKIPLADYVITNDESHAIIPQITTILEKLKT